MTLEAIAGIFLTLFFIFQGVLMYVFAPLRESNDATKNREA